MLQCWNLKKIIGKLYPLLRGLPGICCKAGTPKRSSATFVLCGRKVESLSKTNGAPLHGRDALKSFVSTFFLLWEFVQPQEDHWQTLSTASGFLPCICCKDGTSKRSLANFARCIGVCPAYVARLDPQKDHWQTLPNPWEFARHMLQGWTPTRS